MKAATLAVAAVLAAAGLGATASADTDSLRCHLDRFEVVYPASDDAQDVAVADGKVFVADMFAGLTVYDAAGGTGPIGSVYVAGGFLSIVHAGDVVFVGTETAGLRRIRVTDPTAPVSLGRVAIPDICWDVDHDNGLTVVAARNDGMKIVQTPPTGTMTLLASYTPSGGRTVWNVDIHGSLVAVTHSDGVDFVDITDPATPVLRSTAPDITSRVPVALGDGVAFIVNGADIEVLDLSDPANPAAVGTIPDIAGELRTDAGMLYCSQSVGGTNLLRAFDVSDPAQPVLIGTTMHDAVSEMNGFDVRAGRCYTAQGESGVSSVAIDPPLESPLSRPSGVGIGTAVAGARVAVAPDGSLGFYLKPPTDPDPARLFVLDPYASPGSAPLSVLDLPFGVNADHDLCVADGFVYLSSPTQPLTAVDVTDPTQPQIAGVAAAMSTQVHHLVHQNGSVFGIAWGASIDVHDVSDPDAPVFVANTTVPGTGPITTLTPVGDAYLALGRSFHGVQIVDTSTAPTLSVVGELGGFPISAAVIEGDVLYALYYASSGSELRAIDVSDPTAPALLGLFEWEPATLWGDSGTVTMAGEHLLAVSLEYGRIRFIDVSDPGDMREAGSIGSLTFGFAGVGTDRLLLQAEGAMWLDTGVCADCPADFNGDGQLNFFDLSAFIGAYNAQSADADLAAPFGVFNFFDVAAYIALYNDGCP
jgi:hypothetical protein